MDMTATPAAIYVRISQDRAGEGTGVERQETECRELAERLGWEVVEVYSDNDMSAYSGKPRPAYQRMLQDIEVGKVRGLLAWSPDRLHRRPIELEYFIDLVTAAKLEIHTVRAGDFNLNNETGQAIARTIGAWAKHESDLKGKRIAAARKQAALEGKHHGGVRPFGYEKDGVTLRPDEAAEISRAADSVLAGVSLRSIVRDLNTRGVPTASGKGKWTSQTLRGILLSPRTAGLSSHQGEIVGTAVWPALVPEDRWRAVGAILTNPARTKTSKGGTIKWLGSGIYVCGVCGARELRVSAKADGRRTYRCRNREWEKTSGHVTREAYTLDEYVEHLAVERLSQPGVIEFLARNPEVEIDAEALKVERIELEEQLDSLVLMHVEKKLTARQLEVGSASIRARVEEIDRELAASVVTGPFADLVGVPDVRALWFGSGDEAGLSLGVRRSIVDLLMTVTVLPAPRGREFKPEFIQIDWKK